MHIHKSQHYPQLILIPCFASCHQIEDHVKAWQVKQRQIKLFSKHVKSILFLTLQWDFWDLGSGSPS